MLLSAEIDDERSTTGALSASVSSCHFCVAHSHSPRPFYSKHHAKLEGKIIFLKRTSGQLERSGAEMIPYLRTSYFISHQLLIQRKNKNNVLRWFLNKFDPEPPNSYRTQFFIIFADSLDPSVEDRIAAARVCQYRMFDPGAVFDFENVMLAGHSAFRESRFFGQIGTEETKRCVEHGDMLIKNQFKTFRISVLKHRDDLFHP